MNLESCKLIVGEHRKLTSSHDQHGIIFRQTCPYTSQQNGIVERKHKYIVEKGLTLLAQAGIPFIYWTETFSIAVHLINRLVTLVLDYISPYKAFYHTKPDSHSRNIWISLLSISETL